MNVSQRAAAIEPSATLEIAAKAAAMRAQGRDVLSFSAGEPDFPTPPPICRAAMEAIEKGHTKYTATAGLPEVRQALAKYLGARKGVAIDPACVLLTAGVKSGVYLALLACLDPGEEVLGIAPYWVTYPWAVKIAGGHYRAVAPGPGMRPDLAALRAALTPRTRALLINSPNNPSGVVYTAEEMASLVQFCAEHDLWLLSDEIYEDLVFGGLKHVSPLSVGGDAEERVILLSGFSKSYCMTGWRAGYIVAPKRLAGHLSDVLSHISGNITTPTQHAILEAIHSGGPYLASMQREFAPRRDAMVRGLRSLPGVRCPDPDGAFYVLADFSAHLGGRWKDDAALALAFLEEADVAAVPGAAFGAPKHVRFSYATPVANIEEGMRRLQRFFARQQ
ncbi:MAG: pyridoxal phosphate-dependent aminotransferase [Planctomycetes bacterium]|nr:pyridoxal phosphate-dependent aminotransferase [Planctomycetota bacterium]